MQCLSRQTIHNLSSPSPSSLSSSSSAPAAAGAGAGAAGAGAGAGSGAATAAAQPPRCSRPQLTMLAQFHNKKERSRSELMSVAGSSCAVANVPHCPQLLKRTLEERILPRRPLRPSTLSRHCRPTASQHARSAVYNQRTASHKPAEHRFRTRREEKERNLATKEVAYSRCVVCARCAVCRWDAPEVPRCPRSIQDGPNQSRASQPPS